MVVHFESDLEAAGAVRCEHGSYFFGTKVSFKHIEKSDIYNLRKYGPPVHVWGHGNRYLNRQHDRYREHHRSETRSPVAKRSRESLDRPYNFTKYAHIFC